MLEPTNEWEAKDQETGKQIAKLLCDAVNGGNMKFLINGFVSELSHEHRTLQASAVRMLLTSLVEYAKQANDCLFYDARNEAAVRLIHDKLSPIIKENPIPYI